MANQVGKVGNLEVEASDRAAGIVEDMTNDDLVLLLDFDELSLPKMAANSYNPNLSVEEAPHLFRQSLSLPCVAKLKNMMYIRTIPPRLPWTV